MRISIAIVLLTVHSVTSLHNGVALTPPCGLNSYMAGKGGEAFLTSIADFFVSTGMAKSGFTFVNTDEGWEQHARNATTQRLMWDPNQYPSGIPAMTAALRAKGISFGLYGAASGVTCGAVSGQLGFEDLDVATFVEWGVGYLKSDNCASYAMDSSVRFAATRDAILRSGAPMVYSIEPFSIAPDLRQSRNVAHLWRVGKDIVVNFLDVINRAGISDKWAPLAGPGGWNDPDMIAVGPRYTDAENRAYFGLWALMKAPLLLSADLPNLPASIQSIITNAEVAAVNQDPLGVQARKLLLAGSVLPWLVGLERCDLGVGGGLSGMRNRGFGPQTVDTRTWSVAPHATVNGAVVLRNNATGRCLTPGNASGLDTVVLLPCNASDVAQAWTYGPNARTVAALVSYATGRALTVGNDTLYAKTYPNDAMPVNAAAYGSVDLTMGTYTPTGPCTQRGCDNYSPSQLWYGPDLVDGFIAQATYVASINHCADGDCYVLTSKEPTATHECLAHVLSIRNVGTDAADVEVWGGPLSGGAYVLGLLNTGATVSAIDAPFSAFGVPSIGPLTTFCVRDLWAKKDLGPFTGTFTATIGIHDLGLYRLTPGSC